VEVGDEMFLTIAEAALVTKLAKRSVERLVAAGRFPAVRFGRSLRVPVKGLQVMAETAARTCSVVDSADFADYSAEEAS
jgi:excisionase family DNA binding protein